ncbi:hypothetical protein A3765_28390 [Oleiphilus sp. HI0130]|nr:hypothetical protein A3765_28700 [Oleiphilus sp. HI0130]KZZ72471.1 hypothetical protein A3765_28390 [Oleiphilus sp. HI0130]
MLDKDAIQHIQETAHIPDIVSSLEKHDTAIPVALVPSSMRLEDLESKMPNAARYRLRYATNSIDDFARYNEKHDQAGATCFVDADAMRAHAIYDLGTRELPLHKQNQAKLTLDKTAAFLSLININGTTLSQKQAADFIEDWSDNISVLANDETEMTAAQAAASVRDLTIDAARSVASKVDDFGASMTAMEKIEAKNKEQLPAFLTFTCEPYLGLKERTFNLRLSILTGDEKPRISMRVLRLESIEEDMAIEFKDLIVDSSNGLELETFIGTAEKQS